MQTAIVTGTSTGIGFATALRLAREGCHVHATVRSEASGAALREAAGDLPVSLLVLDVDDDASVANGIASVIAAEGGVDILVNNAGVSSLVSVEGTPLEQFQSVMNTNTWGGLRCIQAVLAHDPRATPRVHREPHVDRGTRRSAGPGRVRGVEVGDGGDQRGAGGRGGALRDPGRDRRTGRECSRRSSTRASRPAST